MSSILALKLYEMKRHGTIKSNAMFWRDFFDKEMIKALDINLESLKKELLEKSLSVVCAFDDNFPNISQKLKPSERPFLFVYKGDINLLNEIDNNIAVIGVLTPTQDIVTREQKIVKELVENNLTVVSGLAKGCDTIAHKVCIDNGGRTIGILPTSFDSIYPKENKNLVDEIVKNNGLVLTEYVSEAKNRFDKIKRFIDRDRLQAMFAKAIVLVASFAQGNGDSGSRHALQKAKEYGKARYVMFDKKTDINAPIFELNKQQILDGATILTNVTIKELYLK